MLTLKRCREILGKDCTLTDEELEMLRDQLYVIADLALTAYEDAPDSYSPDAPSFPETSRRA